MAHEWEDHPPKQLMSARRRQCVHCKKVQVRYAETWWGRVSGYRWLPNAGRCAGVEVEASEEEIEIAGPRHQPESQNTRKTKK